MIISEIISEKEDKQNKMLAYYLFARINIKIFEWILKNNYILTSCTSLLTVVISRNSHFYENLHVVEDDLMRIRIKNDIDYSTKLVKGMLYTLSNDDMVYVEDNRNVYYYRYNEKIYLSGI